MPLIALYPSCILRSRTSQALRRPWKVTHNPLAFAALQRSFYDGGQSLVVEEVVGDDTKGGDLKKYIKEYKASFNVPKPNFQFSKAIPLSQIGQTVTAVGFIGKIRDINRAMVFAPLSGGPGLEKVQVFGRLEINDEARRTLREIPENSAVSVTGVLDRKYEAKVPKKKTEAVEGYCSIDEVEIRAQKVNCLNSFPKDLKQHSDQQFEPKYRHLQIRFDDQLRERLRFRSRVAAFARNELSDFQEVETPLLFKSTPEGAREFIVPTRRRGYAYGLPQSPQQYKQILMASGIQRYVQFAKCFRDEDYRADRQPEFTQIDLEMAWADGEDVMQRVEQFMKALWREFAEPGAVISSPLPDSAFPRMTYDEAMSKHGSDKPDLRIKDLIHRVDHILPEDLRDMLTSLENPVVEACKIRLDANTATVQRFIRDFMDSPLAEEFRNNAAGAPGIFVVDLRRPLEGLQAFGFEGAEELQKFYVEAQETNRDFEEGDLLILQARERLPHTGGSTMLGKLRIAIHKAALAQGLITPDSGHHFLWVTDFPMFTANDGSEPGQEGDSGFSATHHPFTAPKTAADVDMLLTNPLKAIADHYDLVLNGVELGGGSRRIHNAEMQKFVMREILKINAKRMTDFSHLFLALRAGCPPHAGLAIGFDRLVAVMQGRDSVRDVIAFPKDKHGKDLMVKSPSQLSKKRMADYHLQIKDDKFYQAEAQQRDVEARKAQSLDNLKILLDTVANWSANPTKFEGRSNAEATEYEPDTEGSIMEELAKTAQQDNPPQYRPGELLSYAVMLYNQVGGKFLLESLRGFETMIESLGREMQNNSKSRKESRSSTSKKEDEGQEVHLQEQSASKRLERLHSELISEVFSQLRSIESSYKQGSTETVEELRSQLVDTIEPAKLLYSSLRNLEPMIESLNTELESRLREYPQPELSAGSEEESSQSASVSDELSEEEEGQPSDVERPSDPGELSSGLPPSR